HRDATAITRDASEESQPSSSTRRSSRRHRLSPISSKVTKPSPSAQGSKSKSKMPMKQNDTQQKRSGRPRGSGGFMSRFKEPTMSDIASLVAPPEFLDDAGNGTTTPTPTATPRGRLLSSATPKPARIVTPAPPSTVIKEGRHAVVATPTPDPLGTGDT